MPDHPIALSFSERMAGGFALGVTDPAEGRHAGEAAATELAMHATVSISNLDKFLSDPAHSGDLSGTIDFSPLGMAIPTTAGIFNLFCPSGQPGLKLMIYEFAFKNNGKCYYLAGRKEVRDGPGIDVWRDTTTLLTRLHAGTDSTAPVIGAGTLTLTIRELIRLLGTVKVENAKTLGLETEALAKFGSFFLGQLWDTYGPHIKRND